MEYCFLLCLAVSQQPNGVWHCLFLFVLWCLFVLKVLRSFAVVFCLFLSFSFHLEAKKMEDKEGESFKSYVLCCFCFLHMKKLTHLRPEVQLGSEFWFLLFSCLSSATKQGHLFFLINSLILTNELVLLNAIISWKFLSWIMWMVLPLSVSLWILDPLLEPFVYTFDFNISIFNYMAKVIIWILFSSHIYVPLQFHIPMDF